MRRCQSTKTRMQFFAIKETSEYEEDPNVQQLAVVTAASTTTIAPPGLEYYNSTGDTATPELYTIRAQRILTTQFSHMLHVLFPTICPAFYLWLLLCLQHFIFYWKHEKRASQKRKLWHGMTGRHQWSWASRAAFFSCRLPKMSPSYLLLLLSPSLCPKWTSTPPVLCTMKEGWW